MGDIEKIEKMVEKATSDYLIQADWDTNLQIIDMINQDPRKAPDVVRVIQKRLKNSKSRIQSYTIELLEAIVKNCPSSHPLVGSKDFQDDLIKLATKKLKDNTKEKLLDAIQYWADSFQRRGDLQGFSRTYMELKRQNVQFPPRRKEPPLTFATPSPQPQLQPHVVPVIPVVVPSYHPYPAQVYPGNPANPYPVAVPNPSSHSPPPQAPFQKEQVVQSVSVLSEMLSFMNVEDPSQDPTSDEVIQEVLNICKNALPQLRTMLETGQVSDAQLADMISLNDDLTRTIKNYEDIVAKKKAFKEGTYRPEPARPTTTTQSRPPQQTNTGSNRPPTNDLLGDLSSLFTKTTIEPIGVAPSTSPTYNPFATPNVNPHYSTSPPVNNNMPAPVSNANNTNILDEFDMLATRHSTASPTSSLSGPLAPPPTSSNSIYGLAPTPYNPNTSSIGKTTSLPPNSNPLYPNVTPVTYPNPNTSSYGLSSPGVTYAAPPTYTPTSGANGFTSITTYPSVSQPQPVPGSTGYAPNPNMYPSNPSLYPGNVNSYPSAPSTSPTYNNPPLSYASYSSPPNTGAYNYNYPPK
eukprot:TRINITY_DN3859_c0_g1_i1.p1 TRINITY_DN3859_c0_g1~~TRINITY_DN3859_c0_g1_i1.p1  ORF type:complete len:576 (-),score=150.73 TRINITY_DN3859_c0_g1_i1:81-1808(-)